MTPDDPRHGTYAGGRVHRRDNETVCEPCRLAEARYENQRRRDIDHGRPRTHGSLGTRRRIQALVALGHTFSRIGEALDVTPSMAWALAHRPTKSVRITTATKVDLLYEAWSMTLPPAETTLDRRNATYARSVATRHGWVAPLAWENIDTDLEPHGERPIEVAARAGEVDDVVVRRVLAGDVVHANTAERREIVARWPTTGRSLNDLERLTGWKPERYTTATEEDAA